MNDEQILNKGGDEEDIRKYAEENGANLTREDVEMETKNRICKLCRDGGFTLSPCPHSTNNRIREECSVDYNLSPQITEVMKNKLWSEWLEVIRDNEWGGTDEDISDWWLSKIDELLKSQEHKLREEMVEKILSIEIKSDGMDYELVQLRYREKIINLIKK